MTHIINTSGIALACYGRSPSQSSLRGVLNYRANWVGNIMMLLVLVFLYGWLYLAFRRLHAIQSHANFKAARVLIIAASVGLPFQLIRLVHTTTYAFYRVPSLDSFTGSFAASLILVFGTQFGTALALTGGGSFGRHIVPLSSIRVSESCPGDLLDAREPRTTKHLRSGEGINTI